MRETNDRLRALSVRTRAAPWVPRLARAWRRMRPTLIALSLAYGAVLWAAIVLEPGSGWDAHAYWAANLTHPYTAGAGAPGAYLYSPAFRQVIAPLVALGWPVFHAIWVALLIGVLLLLTGPWAIFVLAIPLVDFELRAGNIHILLAAAIALGFRYPATWAFPLLTKVTPGVGVLWFAARREWRHLAFAVGTTAVVVAASFVLSPALWPDWIASLVRDAQLPASAYNTAAVPPLLLRLPLAAILVILGALTDRPWTVPLASLIAIPLLALFNLTLLVGILPLILPDAGIPVRRWVVAWLPQPDRRAATAAARTLSGSRPEGSGTQPARSGPP